MITRVNTSIMTGQTKYGTVVKLYVLYSISVRYFGCFVIEPGNVRFRPSVHADDTSPENNYS